MPKVLTRKTLITASIGAASLYTGYSLLQTKSFNLFSNKSELSRDHFTKYKISWKNDIDSSHYFMELTPVVPQKRNLWKEHGYSKLWSVEVKQPEIHVVRSYTPLPLVHDMNSTDKNDIKVLRDGDNGNGKLMFYIKQYSNGEVARWLHNLPINTEVELRGPYVEYEFPTYPEDEIVRDRTFLTSPSFDIKNQTPVYQPYDINFFTGGTGLVSALQLLLTENPFRGKINLFHGSHELSELGPLLPILHQLENHNRINLYLSTEFSKDIVSSLRSEIGKPYPYKDVAPVSSDFNYTRKTVEPVMSLVVGPEGFIKAVAGEKYDLYQGPILGALGDAGWNNSNVFKLS